MVGIIIAMMALVIILIIMFIVYRAASKCHEGSGGILCKLWHWLA